MKKEKEISVKEVKKIVKKTREEIYQEVLDACINKQLEPYGVTIEEVRKKPKIRKFKLQLKQTLFGFIKYPTFFEEIPWYQYYTFKTEEQFKDWRAFCLLELTGKLKMTKGEAEKEFDSLSLFCGLKQEYGNQG
mgnify:CR=1 FL=1